MPMPTSLSTLDSAPNLDTANNAQQIKPVKAKKPLWQRLAPYLVWQVVAVLAVEGILAVAGLGEEELFKLDREIGTVHMTNKSITWRKEGYARSFIHADGLREANVSVAKPAGVYRVILLGDSQVEGIQVPLEDTAGQLLEKKLTAELGRPVQVLNFGVSGYSTVQEYLLMKRKVFQYAPDLVLLGYDSRDMFENWSEPDSALSNLRPYALKLLGQKMLVDSGSVTAWMKSPRGKFLTSIEWLREHSRIWGLISAYETEASTHNEVYKTVINFFTAPGKTVKKFTADASQPGYFAGCASALGKYIMASITMPSWETCKMSTSGESAATTDKKLSSDQQLSANQELSPEQKAEAEKAIAREKADKEEAAKVKKSGAIFIGVITNTMNALLEEFQNETRAHGSKLLVVGLPSRATLAPISGMDAPMLGTSYEDELKIVKAQCDKLGIPFIDAQKQATRFTKDEQAQMFYTAHLNKTGQKYVADTVQNGLAELIKLDQK